MRNVSVFAISLASQPSMGKHILERLRRAGFRNAELIYAVDGAKAYKNDIQLLSDLARRTLRTQPSDGKYLKTKGAIGCYLSHLHVWNLIVERGLSEAIIVEDDIVFTHQGRDPPAKFITALTKQWNQVRDASASPQADALWFSYVKPPDSKDQVPISLFPKGHKKTIAHVPQVKLARGLFWGTQGYILSAKGAAQLQAHALPIEYQVDAYVGMRASMKSSGNEGFNLAFSDPRLAWEGDMFETGKTQPSTVHEICSQCTPWKNPLTVMCGCLPHPLVYLEMVLVAGSPFPDTWMFGQKLAGCLILVVLLFCGPPAVYLYAKCYRPHKNAKSDQYQPRDGSVVPAAESVPPYTLPFTVDGMKKE